MQQMLVRLVLLGGGAYCLYALNAYDFVAVGIGSIAMGLWAAAFRLPGPGVFLLLGAGTLLHAHGHVWPAILLWLMMLTGAIYDMSVVLYLRHLSKTRPLTGKEFLQLYTQHEWFYALLHRIKKPLTKTAP